ncbi:UNVERIFIED_CONTAM: Ribonuclease HI [Sesamum latifolium]|uniref:Ribonuclease HI n=1 Tax=Sesamum latifolium TaxID=2727402 RepID=A0AAW2UVI5_9LAMI
MTETTKEEVSEARPWLLHVDGSPTAQGSGAGIILTTPQGNDMEFAIKFEFKASNNEAKYEALVLGMRMAQDAGVTHLLAYFDSQLILKQVNGEYEAKEQSMVQYLQQIEELKTKFKSFQLHQIPREENIKAYSLSKLASPLEHCKIWRISVQHQPQPRIPLDIQPISSNNNDWQTSIIRWIDEGHLPGDRWEATKIKTRAIRFLMQGGMLYKKSFTHPLLRCLSQEEGLHVLKEMHDGCCGFDIETWALANKALRAGYFWPTMKQDARYLVNKCEKCQRHATLIHQPAEPLNVMLSPCPFSQWGMDIVGPFPLAPGQKKFLLVAIDYFTKWVKAEPLARITEGEVMKFIWKNIISRFGLPRELISDNGRQFQGRRIQNWCAKLHIKQRFTSVSHPQANGQVEVTNRILVQGIKKRLDRAGGTWVEELTSVMWSYRTTPRGSTGESPFTLVYGTEAVIPVNLGMPHTEYFTLMNSIIPNY